MIAVILAGGLGTRLRPFTELIPKPLLPIGEKSVLEIQIEHLKQHGFKTIYLATNYKSDYIENFLGDGSRYGVSLFYSKEIKPLGTAGPITLLKNKIKSPFLLMNGDVLTLLNYKELYEFGLAQDSVLTVTIKEFLTPFQFGNISFKGNFVTKIEEKPTIKTNILAGVYFMREEVISLIPENEYFGIDSLIQFMLTNKMPISKFEIKDYWLDIGREDDYKKAQEIYETHFQENRKLNT